MVPTARTKENTCAIAAKSITRKPYQHNDDTMRAKTNIFDFVCFDALKH